MWSNEMYVPQKWRWLAIALALVVTSCDRMPNEPEIRADSPKFNSAAGVLTPVRSKTLPIDVGRRTVSNTIGSSGGVLRLSGNSLVVPAGAVDHPTVFTMTLLRTGFIEVELTALSLPPSGPPVPLTTFNEALFLYLSYYRSPDLPGADPTKFVIAHVDGLNLEPVPNRVFPDRKRVKGKLTHFSRYMMASN
jgi:hypothetical protein